MRRGGRRFRKLEAKARNLECWFGLVRYWRTYMGQDAKEDRRGFHPLDLTLGLTKDRLSMLLLSFTRSSGASSRVVQVVHHAVRVRAMGAVLGIDVGALLRPPPVSG